MSDDEGLTTSAHWRKIASHWSHVGPPLRPCPEDVGFVEREARSWAQAYARPPRVLILGVTPELCLLAWPEGTVVRALDRSAEMIDAVWPGDPALATCGDWFSMDTAFPAGSFDFICCDGGLGLLPYPEGQAGFLRQLARLLGPDGVVVLRLFAPPRRRESPDDVLRDLRAGRLASMNVLKLRLLHAMTPNLETGVRLGDVFERIFTAEPDFAALSARVGWPIAQVVAIESYRASEDRYHLAGPGDIEPALASAGLRVTRILKPGYDNGELFPTLICSRRV